VGVVLAVYPTLSTASASIARDKSNNQPIIVGVPATLSTVVTVTEHPIYDSFVATVNWINANGGVNGHKIKLVTEDDQNSATQNLTAVQSLVESKGAQIIVDIASGNTPEPGGAPWLKANNIPTIAKYTPDCTNDNNFFCPVGGDNPNPDLGNLTNVKFLKTIPGVHKVGGLAVTACAACALSAKAEVAGAPMVGLKKGYVNTTLQLGVTNFTPAVLGFKSNHTDTVDSNLDITTTLGFIAAEKQQGLNLTVLSGALYQPSLLTGVTKAVMQGVYVNSPNDPNAADPAVQMETHILRAYGDAKNANPPGTNEGMGYAGGLLLKEMLQVGGTNPTQSSMIDNMNKVTNWKAGGVFTYDVNFTREHTSNAPLVQGPCEFFLQARGSQFVSLTKTPICTKTIKLNNV